MSIIIGPKQIRNPKSVIAQIEMEKALGNETDLRPSSWKLLLAELENIHDWETLKESLAVLKQLAKDGRYSRNFDQARHKISRTLHQVLPKFPTAEVVLEHMEHLLWSTEANLLTPDQCLMLAAHPIPDTQYGQRQAKHNLDTLVLRAGSVLMVPEAIIEIASHPDYSHNVFLHQCRCLETAAAAIGADPKNGSDLFWKTVRLLFDSRYDHGNPIQPYDLAQFTQFYNGRVQFEVQAGQFVVKFREVPHEEEKKEES